MVCILKNCVPPINCKLFWKLISEVFIYKYIFLRLLTNETRLFLLFPITVIISSEKDSCWLIILSIISICAILFNGLGSRGFDMKNYWRHSWHQSLPAWYGGSYVFRLISLHPIFVFFEKVSSNRRNHQDAQGGLHKFFKVIWDRNDTTIIS